MESELEKEWSQITSNSLKFYRPLVAGRAAEYKVYNHIYRSFEDFLSSGISIFDQVADIDDVDFSLRIETPYFLGYFDCQVRSSRAGKWNFTRQFLDLLELRQKNKMHSLIFLVDSRGQENIYIISGEYLLTKAKPSKGLTLHINDLPSQLQGLYEIIAAQLSSFPAS